MTTRTSVRRIQSAGSSSSASVGSLSGPDHARLSASIPPRATTASQKRLPCSYWRIFMSSPSRRSRSLNSGGRSLRRRSIAARSFATFGRTGARIMATLLNVMETDDKQIGLETMCVAGGQGFAMVVERLN